MAITTNSMVALFPFNDNYNDSRGNLTVTATGNLELSSIAKFGNAAHFTSSVDRIAITPETGLDFGTGDFTISFWMRVDEAPTGTFNSQNAWPVLAGGSYAGGAVTYPMVLALTNGSIFHVHLANGTVAHDISNAYVIGDFHHFVVERYGAVLTVYIDGTVKSSTNIGAGFDLLAPLAPGYVIGNFSGATYGGAITPDIYIDDFVIYNYAVYRGLAYPVPTAATELPVDTGSKEIQVNQLINMLNVSVPGFQMGVVTPENYYNMMYSIYEMMGYKNPDKYVSHPKEGQGQGQIPPEIQEAMQEAQKTIQELEQKLMQAENKRDIEAAKIQLEKAKLLLQQQELKMKYYMEQEKMKTQSFHKLLDIRIARENSSDE